MENFELTFQFDDLEQTLTRFNGLSISQLAKILQALSKTLSNDEDSVVLSEIKGNCYAPVISTNNRSTFEQIKIVHTVIAENNYNTLTKDEKSYAKVLSDIIAKGYILNVYNENKSYYKKIEKVAQEDIFKHYYSTDAKRGYLTRIGSRDLDSKKTIFISSYPNEIEIDNIQETVLTQYFKNTLIEFYITEKINKETKKVENVTLDSLEVIKNTNSFYDNVETTRLKHGEFFANFNDLIDNE